MTWGQFCLSFTSLLPESYCPETILVLLVSELLAGGGQAPVKSAIALFKTKDVPEAALEAGYDAAVGGVGAAGGVVPIGLHPPQGDHIPLQGGNGLGCGIPANPGCAGGCCGWYCGKKFPPGIPGYITGLYGLYI